MKDQELPRRKQATPSEGVACFPIVFMICVTVIVVVYIIWGH